MVGDCAHGIPMNLRCGACEEDHMSDIDVTLAERGRRYGTYAEQARIAQAIKRAMVDSPNWTALPDEMKDALEMNAVKISRILNGDPNYHDNWHDIIGYIRLIADQLPSAPAAE